MLRDWMHYKASCAGQGCPERDGCLRFEERRPIGNIKGLVLVAWASFDIERQARGHCRHRQTVSEQAGVIEKHRVRTMLGREEA